MKKLISRNALKIGIALVLVVGLVVGVALPVLAAQQDKQAGRAKILQSIIRGEVVSKDDSSFNVKTNKGEVVAVLVDAQTKFFLVPGPAKAADVSIQKAEQVLLKAQVRANADKTVQKPVVSNKAVKAADSVGPKAEGKGILVQDDLNWLKRLGKAASFADLAIGDKVLVYPAPATTATASTTTAKIVLIIKQPAIKQIEGTIQAVGSGSITIAAGGTTITLSYDKDTVFVLKGVILVQQGQKAHVVYNVEKKLAKRVSINGAED